MTKLLHSNLQVQLSTTRFLDVELCAQQYVGTPCITLHWRSMYMMSLNSTTFQAIDIIFYRWAGKRLLWGILETTVRWISQTHYKAYPLIERLSSRWSGICLPLLAADKPGKLPMNRPFVQITNAPKKRASFEGSISPNYLISFVQNPHENS